MQEDLLVSITPDVVGMSPFGRVGDFRQEEERLHRRQQSGRRGNVTHVRGRAPPQVPIETAVLLFGPNAGQSLACAGRRNGHLHAELLFERINGAVVPFIALIVNLECLALSVGDQPVPFCFPILRRGRACYNDRNRR